MFTLVRHDARTITSSAVLVCVMMRFKVMGSRRGLSAAVAAGLGCLASTVSPAKEPDGLAGPPVRLEPGTTARSNTIPLSNAPLLDVFDVADAIAQETVRDMGGAVVCLAGCNGPRGTVVQVVHAPAWHVASIDTPAHAASHATTSPTRLAAECIAGCDAGRGIGAERPARPAGVTRLPQRATGETISASRHLVVMAGRSRIASPAPALNARGIKRRAAAWTLAQRPIRLR